MRMLVQFDYRQSALCGSRRRLCSHAVRAVWAQRRVRQRGRTRVCVWAAIQISCTARGWGESTRNSGDIIDFAAAASMVRVLWASIASQAASPERTLNCRLATEKGV